MKNFTRLMLITLALCGEAMEAMENMTRAEKIAHINAETGKRKAAQATTPSSTITMPSIPIGQERSSFAEPDKERALQETFALNLQTSTSSKTATSTVSQSSSSPSNITPAPAGITSASSSSSVVASIPTSSSLSRSEKIAKIKDDAAKRKKQQAEASQYTEDVQGLQEAIQQSLSSEKTFRESILKTGIYPKKNNETGRPYFQLALEEQDKQPTGYEEKEQRAENITCGPRALMIAQALNALFTKHEAITPITIHKNLPTNYTAIMDTFRAQNMQLSSIDFLNFIKENNIDLNNFLALGSYDETLIIPLGLTEQEEIDSSQRLAELPAILRSFSRTLTSNPRHFICSDRASGHWVLISVILDKGQPTLWYIDPKNMNIDNYPQAHKFVTYIMQNMFS